MIRLPKLALWLGLWALLANAAMQAQSPATDAPKPDTSQTSTSLPRSQNPSPAQNQDLVVKVSTRLVVVDVVVHDKKDQVVPDLEPSDFTVREDGTEQKVSTFSFQRAPATAALATTQGTAAPNVFRNVPRFQSSGALNVILLDALNTTMVNQAYVRVEMVKFLEKLPPGHPVAIYALGGKLRLLQDFTTDLSELKRIVRAFKGEGSHVLRNPAGTSEAPMTLQGIAEQTLAEMAPQFKVQMEAFAGETTSNQTDFQIQHTMAALTLLARMLAGYPGRKNLIWITEGIPMNIYAGSYITVTGIGNAPQRSTGNPESNARGARSYSDQLALLGNMMADAQVAVYPVDARGLVGTAMSNVANNVSGQGAIGGAASRMEGAQAEALFQAHSNMRDIAANTGGTAFFNRNDLDNAVRNDMEDGATYYTIGYYPSNKEWNGRFRKIQVAVKRPGVKLRYRTGYFAVQRAEYMKDHPQQRDSDLSLALNPDTPLATSMQFAVAVLPPGKAQSKVVLNYAVDARGISFVMGKDGLQHVDVDCAVSVFSPGKIDKPVRSDTARFAVALKPEIYESVSKSYFPCQVPLSLEPGSYLLRAVVRDNTTGNLGSVNAQVVVPAVSAAEERKPADDASHTDRK